MRVTVNTDREDQAPGTGFSPCEWKDFGDCGKCPNGWKAEPRPHPSSCPMAMAEREKIDPGWRP